MVNDASIFRLRFGSNPRLHPSDEDIREFLKSRKEGAKSLHHDELKPYQDLLSSVAEYKISGNASLTDRILYTLLTHSHIARPALKSVVEEYKYHIHQLAMLDFKKPETFIKSAEAEIARLNPKKKEEAGRAERMQAMVEDRRKFIAHQKKRWLELAEELKNILSYVTDNLGKIEKLCELSIGLLVGEQVDRKKEQGLIEDIKAEFKERLRASLHEGTITKEQMETARDAVAQLSKRTADLVRADIFAITQLYEKIHEHAGRMLAELATVFEAVVAQKHTQFEEDLALFQKAEVSLVALLTGCSFEIKVSNIEVRDEHDRLLDEKRKEMLRHLFTVLGA